MLVTAVEARPLRSLTDVRVELGEGIVSLIGPNGAGKTNLLEASTSPSPAARSGLRTGAS